MAFITALAVNGAVSPYFKGVRFNSDDVTSWVF